MTIEEISDLKLRVEELEKIVIAMASGSGQSISLHNGRPVLLGVIGGSEQVWRTSASSRSS